MTNTLNEFPKTLYVEEPMEDDSSLWSGYTNFADVPNGNVIGVYQLVKVCRVQETTSRDLIQLRPDPKPSESFTVGDKVRLKPHPGGTKLYFDSCSNGKVTRVTTKRVVVQWGNGKGRARNHAPYHLEKL